MEDCLPQQEQDTIAQLNQHANAHLKEGNIYFILDNKWFLKWKRYTGELIGDDDPFDDDFTSFINSDNISTYKDSKPPRPGLIDNSHLLENGTEVESHDLELREFLQEGSDYVLVPQEVWKKLQHWYKGGPALPRRMLEFGHKQFTVEVYPLRLHIVDARDHKEFVIQISKKTSVHELYRKICDLLQLEEDKVHIYDYYNRTKSSLLESSTKSLDEIGMLLNHHILLEVQQDDGSWSPDGLDSTGNRLALIPIEPSKSSFSIAGGSTLSNGDLKGSVRNTLDANSIGSPVKTIENGFGYHYSAPKDEVEGLAGLQNLGNTCFMNSALQCLVHTAPLVEYFLKDYCAEINEENPLGMHGELAIAFGDLLRKLWSSGRGSIAPRFFKGKLARFAPQFSGYNQHDSQELLAFLLDGLHEDLNRVKSKPYIETKDVNGRSDEDFANECWENHKVRNDSIIVDVCQGQYKSTLICPTCSKVSVTFDPFMYLSLPLPSTTTRKMTVTVISSDGSALPMPYTVTVLKDGSCKNLLEALSAECGLKSDEILLLAEVHNHNVFRYLENSYEDLSVIKNNEYLVAFRLCQSQNLSTRLEIVHRAKDKYVSEYYNSYGKANTGTPLVTYLKEGTHTKADIQNAVRVVLAPLLKLKPDQPSTQVISTDDTEPGSSSNIDTLDDYDCDTVSVDERDEVEEVDEMDEVEEVDEMDEVSDISNENASFKLFLTDDRGWNSNNLIENDTIIGPGKFVKVLLDWSEKEHNLYDISYLKDLPAVCKSSNAFSLKKTPKEEISLFSCLEAFLKEEPLGPDDMWYCPNCKEHKQAMKKLDLWRLPEVLVVHLKRFSYSRYYKNKLDTYVNFPISNLDLSKYVTSNAAAAESHVYKLYAISNHYGGLGGGHYSAYTKLLSGNKWYDFDDSHVTAVNETDIRTANAYVLFYRRSRSEKSEEMVVNEPPSKFSSTSNT